MLANEIKDLFQKELDSNYKDSNYKIELIEVSENFNYTYNFYVFKKTDNGFVSAPLSISSVKLEMILLSGEKSLAKYLYNRLWECCQLIEDQLKELH